MSVKALARGLQVLSAVNELNPALVKDVVETTELPKATVIRLLKSLVEEGYLIQDEHGRGYRVTAAARKLSRALGEQSRYASIGDPVLRQLGHSLKYPSILTVQDGESMIIEATNRSTASIRLKLFERSRMPILESAAGVAWLSALDPVECENQISSFGSRQNLNPGLGQIIQQARIDGFARRPYPSLNNLTALALPVREGDHPVGSLTVVYFEELMHPEILNNVVMQKMRDAIRNIEQSLNENPPTYTLSQAV